MGDVAVGDPVVSGACPKENGVAIRYVVLNVFYYVGWKSCKALVKCHALSIGSAYMLPESSHSDSVQGLPIGPMAEQPQQRAAGMSDSSEELSSEA